jgi:hypothetical protein
MGKKNPAQGGIEIRYILLLGKQRLNRPLRIGDFDLKNALLTGRNLIGQSQSKNAVSHSYIETPDL